MTGKLNLVQEHRKEYGTPSAPEIVDVGPGMYLTIEGRGAPEGEEFGRKVGALYSLAYTIKMASKATGHDFTVAPLEGLWWFDGEPDSYLQVPREEWRWKLLIRVPDFIAQADLYAAVRTLQANGKGGDTPEVSLERLQEGKSVQMLHVGPYATEPQTIERMDGFVREHDLAYRGAHHEIYISDPRRTAPERLRTILRHPVVRK